jgi:hypothetical protein
MRFRHSDIPEKYGFQDSDVLSNNASRGKVEAIPGSKSVSEGTFRSRSLELSS